MPEFFIASNYSRYPRLWADFHRIYSRRTSISLLCYTNWGQTVSLKKMDKTVLVYRNNHLKNIRHKNQNKYFHKGKIKIDIFTKSKKWKSNESSLMLSYFLQTCITHDGAITNHRSFPIDGLPINREFVVLKSDSGFWRDGLGCLKTLNWRNAKKHNRQGKKTPQQIQSRDTYLGHLPVPFAENVNVTVVG